MNWSVFIIFTVIFAGSAAYMTGQALASTWRPYWQVLIYCLPLGLANRFIVFALFDGELLALSGFLVDTAVLMMIGLLAFRITQAAKMVNQYPWLYKRVGLFGWREMNAS